MQRFQSMDLNLLRLFDVVMQERSLTRAAERLCLTQPATSNALRRLRVALNDELLVRSGHGLEPTPLAMEIWPTIHESMLQLRNAIAPETFCAATSNATFYLGMADATATFLLPNLVRLLEQEAPDICIRVMSLISRDPRELLESGELDAAIGYFPAVMADLTAREQSNAGVAFEARLLYQRDYMCAMNKKNPIANQPLTLDAYCNAQHVLVSFSGRAYGFVDEALSALGRSRKIKMTVNQYLTAAHIAAKTNLLTIVPRHYLDSSELARELVVRELPLKVTPASIDMLWRRQDRYQRAIQWLLDLLLRSVAAHDFTSFLTSSKDQ